MGGRKYAQIDCSLLNSRKWRSLSNDTVRMAYVCTHLSPYGNFRGLFRYPSHIFSHDLSVEIPELETIITELEDCELIQFDRDNEIVRIVDWFHKRNGAENASHALGIIKDFECEADDHTSLRIASIVEFSCAIVKRSLTWKPDSPDQTKLRNGLKPFLNNIQQEYGREFLDSLSAALKLVGKPTRSAMIGLLPALSETVLNTLPTPSTHPVETLIRDKTRQKIDLNKDPNPTHPLNDKSHQVRDRDGLTGCADIMPGATKEAIAAAKRLVQ